MEGLQLASLSLALLASVSSASPLAAPSSLDLLAQHAAARLDTPLLASLASKHRDKRFVIELPKGFKFEMESILAFPFESFTRFTSSALAFYLIIDKPYPAEILYDTDKPTLKDLYPEKYYDAPILHRRRREAAGAERSRVYEALLNLLTEMGLEGRPCLLRSVCEVAEAPFEDEHFLAGLLNTVLTPSRGNHSSALYEDLLAAEQRGGDGLPCHYPACPSSVFDRLPFLTHSVAQ